MDRLLTRRDVESVVGLSRSSIYAMIASGAFPAPIRIGKRAVRFSQSDIESWVNGKRER